MHDMSNGLDPENAEKIDLRDLLNAQTGRVAWSELQRHFARGMLFIVDKDLDLIETATRIIDDDAQQVSAWIDNKRLMRADLDHARAWEAAQTQFWAVVAAPWVLVQEVTETEIKENSNDLQ